jgi:hypothetical protein
MSSQLTPTQQRLYGIFHPLAAAKDAEAREAEARGKQVRFVYYTRAETAMQIIKNRRIWMRKSACMNDFTEIQYGLNHLYKAYGGSLGTRLRTILNSLFSGLYSEVEKIFDDWTGHPKFDTYITSVSEHKEDEDTFGRLSMWRAYGGTTGVALVMKSEAFQSTVPSDVLKIYGSPVAYLDEAGFVKAFSEVVDNIESNADFLKEQSREEIRGRLYRMFAFAAVCTKHPSFYEELEWRVMYFPWWERSEYVKREIEVIGGAPQPVHKIPLEDIAEKNLSGLTIPALIDRIIVGPTRDPVAIRDAFLYLLLDAGVERPLERIFLSGIPLRV